VPGPEVPLYLAGARLLTYWPVSIVEHGLGLNITLQSYAGSLDFGILAARAGMADARPLARGLHEALAELSAAADSLGTVAASSPAGPRAGRRQSLQGAAARPPRTLP
jgi:hypothetical protein